MKFIEKYTSLSLSSKRNELISADSVSSVSVKLNTLKLGDFTDVL